jgi:uncharacterized protein
MEEGGLEYLFGVYLFEKGKEEIKTFWVHSREEEKKAFEEFMDFCVQTGKSSTFSHVSFSF